MNRPCRRWIAGPLGLALIVTLANAIRPVVVDDTAYLAFARHIAHHPLDPYGFTIFWYTVPEPAMEVLAPPVVPYWLALGMRLLGENVPLLKLWMFPFAWILAWSLGELLRRFARGTEAMLLPLIIFSLAIISSLNFMLDVPAIALYLAAMALFPRAVDRGSWRLSLAAGALAGLALQTKYTALIAPPLLVWYGLTHRGLRFAILASASALIVFAGWEAFLGFQYGQSHFLFHLSAQSQSLGETLRAKADLLPPLFGHLGLLAIGIGLASASVVGVPRRFLLGFAIAWSIGALLIAMLPYRDTILVSGKHPGHVRLSLASVVWRTAGVGTLLAGGVSALLLLIRRCRGPRRIRWSAESAFLVGWVFLEIGAYFALTPFPAARRVIGVTIALGLLTARAACLVGRVRSDRRIPRWILAFAISVGILGTALDTFDAFPEKVLAIDAAKIIEQDAPASRAWFVGHWGFQYYCKRVGMIPLVPGHSVLQPGDYLVLPLYPDEFDFYRPHAGSVSIHPPEDHVHLISTFVWTDWLSGQTVPNYYGGVEPIMGRDAPRLRIGVYRMTRTWVVPGH